MNWRGIVIVLILTVLVFLALAYSGIFMHGDPIVEPNN